MPKLNISLFEGRPLFDIASYARPGPGRRAHLSPAEIAQISRTVRRVPEAVVKVLPKDASSLGSVRRHIGYLGRYGGLALETEEGEHMKGRDLGSHLIEDWDLDLDEYRRKSDLTATGRRQPPRLAHKLMLSMPPGTPPQSVLAAARNFLREEFALKHRYAFVLHTDEPHPHVHAVVKAVSEQGVRLHIKKATLRRWRQEFARHLRDQGIEANATERSVRGETRVNKRDGIYRAHDRGASSHMRERAEAAAAWLKGHRQGEVAVKLVQTRQNVRRGWLSASDILVSQGEHELAGQVRRFLDHMSPPNTEKEQLVHELHRRLPVQMPPKRPATR